MQTQWKNPMLRDRVYSNSLGMSETISRQQTKNNCTHTHSAVSNRHIQLCKNTHRTSSEARLREKKLQLGKMHFRFHHKVNDACEKTLSGETIELWTNARKESERGWRASSMNKQRQCVGNKINEVNENNWEEALDVCEIKTNNKTKLLMIMEQMRNVRAQRN